MGIAHEHQRVGAARPGEDLEPVVVVVVVSTLTLGQGAPGAGDVTRGVHVLEKMERERLIGEDGPRQRRTLRRRERFVGQAARLLQRAQVEGGVHTDRTDVRAGPQHQRRVIVQGDIGLRPRQKEVRIVRARAGRVLRIGALQAQVGRAQRVGARGAHGSGLEPSSQLADSRLGVRRRGRRSRRSGRDRPSVVRRCPPRPESTAPPVPLRASGRSNRNGRRRSPATPPSRCTPGSDLECCPRPRRTAGSRLPRAPAPTAAGIPRRDPRRGAARQAP